MRSFAIYLIAISSVLTACSTPIPDSKPPLPESVLSVVGPKQDLANTKIDPETGCVFYLHNGQVETTWLPLRSKTGGTICITYVDKEGNPVERNTS
jgi:hypothetical protein